MVLPRRLSASTHSDVAQVVPAMAQQVLDHALLSVIWKAQGDKADKLLDIQLFVCSWYLGMTMNGATATVCVI